MSTPRRSLTTRRLLSLSTATAASAVLAAWLVPACAPGSESTGRVSLQLAIPKAGILDVDTVKLYVYDQSVVACDGPTIKVPPESAERIFELALAKCAAGWCGEGTLEKNPDRVLTFYVEGRFTAKEGGFSGCTERAVDQDPLQVDMKAQPLVVGGKCGDLKISYKETCDPGLGVSDEACDGATCQTKEVVLSNGLAVDQFYRGLPGRKTGLSIGWLPDGRFLGIWSDAALGSSGGDGSAEITFRRLSGDILTETTPAVLAREVRLPAFGAGANSNGSAKRAGVDTTPTLVPLASGDYLVVFLHDGRVVASVQKANFGSPPSTDVDVSATSSASSPHAAAGASGAVLIVYVEANQVKSVLRQSDGTLGSPQTLSTGATAEGPRVAFAGSDWVVVWSDGNDIKMRRVGADGTAKGSESVVNQAKTPGKQDQPAIAALSTGEILVAWRDAAGDVGADIRLQKFDATGAATGTEIGEVVNDVHKDGDQGNPADVAGKTPSGTPFYLVAWTSPATGQIGARFVKGTEVGYLQNYVNGLTSEFEAGVGAKPRGAPAVACAPSQLVCAIGWADDSAGDAAADDDRVRVRRFPSPEPPK